MLLHIEEFSAKEIVDGARAAASVVDLPQVRVVFVEQKTHTMRTGPTLSTRQCALAYVLRALLEILSGWMHGSIPSSISYSDVCQN